MLKKIIYLCFAVVLFISCGDDPLDPCEGVDCGSNGICVTGTCDCEDGYLGANCDIVDLCFGVDCGDNGTCVDGICECEFGYYGDSCELLVQDKFTGIWIGMNCGQAEEFFIMIKKASGVAALLIEEFTFDINAIIISENTFEIYEQEVSVPDGSLNIFGTGKILEDGRLEFDATTSLDGGMPTHCFSIMDKF